MNDLKLMAISIIAGGLVVYAVERACEPAQGVAEPVVINLDSDPNAAKGVEPMYTSYDKDRTWLLINLGTDQFKLNREQAGDLMHHLLSFGARPYPQQEPTPEPLPDAS